MRIADPQPADVTFSVTFGAEPDASCIEAADTVTTRVVECDTVSGGTAVEFTYTNTDDATDKSHTRPVIKLERWDNNQFAFVLVTDATVADGASASHIGGTGGGDGSGIEFYLSPGTYYMRVATKEYGDRKLPNALFVPACNGVQPPKGDPLGGAAPTNPPPNTASPKGTLRQVSPTKMRAKAINKGVSRSTTFKVVLDPRKGSTVTKRFTVPAGGTQQEKYISKPGTKFVLAARVKKSSTWSWVVLKRATLR